MLAAACDLMADEKSNAARQGGVFRRLVNRPEEGGVQYIGDTEWDQKDWDLGAFEPVEVGRPLGILSGLVGLSHQSGSM